MNRTWLINLSPWYYTEPLNLVQLKYSLAKYAYSLYFRYVKPVIWLYRQLGILFYCKMLWIFKKAANGTLEIIVCNFILPLMKKSFLVYYLYPCILSNYIFFSNAYPRTAPVKPKGEAVLIFKTNIFFTIVFRKNYLKREVQKTG